MSRTPQFPDAFDGFDPNDRKWYVLGCKTFADIPSSTTGTPFDPWQIAGETSDAPDGTNDQAAGDYANVSDPLATQPGHCWPFMCLGATSSTRDAAVGQSAPSTISAGGAYPANFNKQGINHYRRFVRLAPRMFGSDGRDIIIPISGRLKATNAIDCLDIILHHDLVTSVDGAGANTTALTAGKYTGFRWVLGNLGAAEVSFDLTIIGRSMGAFKQTWHAHLVVAAQANPQITAPAVDARRGPVMLDLTSTGPNMDTTGSLLALLFAARGSTAITFDQLGVAGGAAQDGSETYVKVGKALCLLSPGH